MAIELEVQDIMVKNMCVKFGEDWTNSFQELDRKQSSGCTYVTYGQGQPYMPPLCGGIKSITRCAYIRTSIIPLLFGKVSTKVTNLNYW